MIDTTKRIPTLRQILSARLRAFGHDEGGAIIAMTLIFFLTMLVLGGIAVDFMRFESRRAMLQSTADRAVLAAAKIPEGNLPGNYSTLKAAQKATVVDYFEKSGFSGSIVGEPSVGVIDGYNTVSVESRFEIDSLFIDMLGIEKLSAPAASTALEGVSDIEISLVVDISGSMAYSIPATATNPATTRIAALRSAATKFVENMLVEKYEDKISISLVPYTEQVNIGPTLMSELNITKLHDFSHCVDFEDSAFNSLAISTTYEYEHMQNWQWNGAKSGEYSNSTSSPICPRESYERIIPHSQNETQLVAAISQLTPRAGTSIFLGLKWGLALLDPSMRGPLAPQLNGTPFAGRPAEYNLTGTALDTRKIIVLMTDGQNDVSNRLYPEYASTPSHFAHWDLMNWSYHKSQLAGGSSLRSWYYEKYNNAVGNTLMQQLCTLAKAQGVIIYAVAVDATSDGITQMNNCASSSAHFYNATGNDLDGIFTSIARQISELRLSQ